EWTSCTSRTFWASGMAYRQLFLFVEGDDDARFFQTVAVPFFRQRYESVEIIRDLDRHPCVTAAKKTLLQRCSPAEAERIQIVKTEIESWYSAGIPEGDPEWGQLPIAVTPDTQTVTKELFLRVMSASGSALLPTMLSLLERFDRKRAASRNASFRYFLGKHLPEAL
ncbi:MAG TPA: hypothetical protein VKM72_05335, partial [Thermoanaerobaculia bacterium]|nr:hypothetical protein [Thermoanaerobaculia bacterium]